MNRRTTILLGILIILALVFLFVIDSDDGDLVESPTPIPDISGSPASGSAEPTPTGESVVSTPTPNMSPLPLAPADDFAKCSIGGKLICKEQHLAINEGAQITYTDIDSISRHIKWTIKTDSGEDIGIGPNLFASLPLPDGQENITVVFYDEPEHDNYTLTAKVTYGVQRGLNIHVEEVDCSGKTKVEIDY